MDWEEEEPIDRLPKAISDIYANYAGYLRKDLEENKLEVELIDPPGEVQHTGHQVREAVSQNPKWYRKLYKLHSGFRRDLSEQALDRIKAKEDQPYNPNLHNFWYDTLYRRIIHRSLYKGINENGRAIKPEEKVVNYFDHGIIPETNTNTKNNNEKRTNGTSNHRSPLEEKADAPF